MRTIETPPHHFGDRGDVVLPVFGAGSSAAFSGGFSGSLGGVSVAWVSFTHASSVQSFERQDVTAVDFAPNMDFFIARHVSLGGSVGFGYSRVQLTPVSGAPDGSLGFDNGAIDVSISPRVGYVFPVSDRVALWPRLSIGAGVVDGIGGTGPIPINLSASADLQVVYSIDRRFFVSVGPAFGVQGNPKYGIYESSIATALSGTFQTGFVL